MNKLIAILSLAFLACDPAQVAEFRGGSTSGTTGAVEPIKPNVEWCECNPKEPLCGEGLECVPTGNGDQHACLAKCSGINANGGGFITTCPETCFYPFLGEKGTGPAYCPSCIRCGPVDPLSLVCQ
jgi:hypothetical protein